MKDSVNRTQDWDPRSAEVQSDQVRAYDNMRENCPVAWSDYMHWTLFRHEDVMSVLLDHKTFSNAVSKHLSVPNAMDAPEHTPYRIMIERYFTHERVSAFAPICRDIATELVNRAVTDGNLEIMQTLAYPFAADVQCAFLGWPITLADTLVNWVKENQTASFAQDRRKLSELAVEFEKITDDQIEARQVKDSPVGPDVTSDLVDESVWGRPLSNEEISSVLRNWTVGEIGTISHSVGILLHFLASNQDIQARLRADPLLLPAANDEILRIHNPLTSNRRIATKDVEIGGRQIQAGEKLTLMWVSANRDPEVFFEPNTFRLDRDESQNLLWGAGLHVCPGAPLARLELRILMETVLGCTQTIQFDESKPPVNAVYPSSGYEKLWLKLR